MTPASYATLLRTPGAAAFFSTAGAGRIGIAMTSLGLVWLVHDATGSYATAGLVTGGFAVAEAVVGPQLGRLVDRFGQTRVLPWVLLVHAGAVTALLALVAAGARAGVLTAAGVVVGASIPQLGALSAARWSVLLRGQRATALPTAFSLESLSNGLAYLVGPVLVSAVAAAGHPALGTVSAALLVVTGGAALAAQRGTAPPPAASGHSGRSRQGRQLLRPALVVLVGINLAVGVYFGAMQVSVAAFAVQHDAPGMAAGLYAVGSCGGLLAAWLYGSRTWRAAPNTQLAVATAGLALACLPLLVAETPLGLGVVVALTGMAVPPVLVLCTVLTESGVHPRVLTQALTWLASASAAGSAGAAAVSGRAVDALGAQGGFAVAVAAAATTALLASAGLRALHR